MSWRPSRLPQEPSAVVPAADTPLIEAAQKRGGGTWPACGSVRFEAVKMRYRPGMPLVLSGVDISLADGVKAAVVGRSGAGKSSLSVALLRLVALDAGRILLDGVDISTLGLQLLRRAITFIPQDAILFTGQLRYNMDPFGEHSDASLEAALKEVDFRRLSGLVIAGPDT